MSPELFARVEILQPFGVVRQGCLLFCENIEVTMFEMQSKLFINYVSAIAKPHDGMLESRQK
jgi:hypothetical protein